MRTLILNTLLLTLLTSPAMSQELEIPVRWKAGDKVVYDLKRTETSKTNGRVTKQEGTSALTIEVLNEFEQGYVIRWTISDTKLGKNPNLEQMPELQGFLKEFSSADTELRLAIDRKAQIRKLLNRDRTIGGLS